MQADAVIEAGDILYRDLLSLLPYPDGLVVLGVTGKNLLVALENGVSQYPKLDGRFPCVSGMSFSFDAALPPGSRVDGELVRVHGKKIDLEKEYTLVTTHFIGTGHDGYSVFTEARTVLSVEQTPVIPTLVLNEFKTLEILKDWRRGTMTSMLAPKRLCSMSKYGGGPDDSGAATAADVWLSKVRDKDHGEMSLTTPPSVPIEVDGRSVSCCDTCGRTGTKVPRGSGRRQACLLSCSLPASFLLCV
jgi:hypothetical protein